MPIPFQFQFLKIKNDLYKMFIWASEQQYAVIKNLTGDKVDQWCIQCTAGLYYAAYHECWSFLPKTLKASFMAKKPEIHLYRWLYRYRLLSVGKK